MRDSCPDLEGVDELEELRVDVVLLLGVRVARGELVDVAETEILLDSLAVPVSIPLCDSLEVADEDRDTKELAVKLEDAVGVRLRRADELPVRVA